MIILGIDHGRAKLGLAKAETPLAEPYRVIKVNSQEDALAKVIEEIAKINADEIIVGVSEGEMAKEQKNFAARLKERVKLPVRTWDETLSTKDAQLNALSGGVGRKKRADMEDAFAATVMLQSYLDSQDKQNLS